MEAVLAVPRRWSLADARPFFAWVAGWIILPNICFWILSLFSGPPRLFETLIIGSIGLALHRAPFAVKFGAFVAVMIFSVLVYVSAIFNLSPLSLTHSLEFASELNPIASPEYILCGVAAIVVVFAGYRVLRCSTALGDLRVILLAFGLVLSVAAAEKVLGGANRGSYKRFAEPGALFTSGVERSGFGQQVTDKRHLMIVMVESMGRPVNPQLRGQLVDLWARPEVRRLYEVTTGDTLYYGSTTSGEMRELCGRWGNYAEVMAKADRTCLPARLAARGYRTQAWHSFKGEFFDRSLWYPNIGFAETRFGEQLLADGADECPGVFPGACDRDVPAQIANALKRAKEPQFLYWLTVNSHLPVIKDERLGTTDCAKFEATLAADFPMTCRIFELFDSSGRALAREITASDFPTADILIVGDHIPPFFNRHDREQFASDSVPWILLRRKTRNGHQGPAHGGSAGIRTVL